MEYVVYSFGVKNNIWIEVIVEVKWLSWKKVKSDHEECSTCPTYVIQAGIACHFYIYWEKVNSKNLFFNFSHFRLLYEISETPSMECKL